jgi:hypothetical protein
MHLETKCTPHGVVEKEDALGQQKVNKTVPEHPNAREPLARK